MKMRALVTGAAGFIGSHLTERLIRRGHQVIAVDCLTDYYDIGQKRVNLEIVAALPRCSVVQRDLRSCHLSDLLDVDVVFHQAGQPGVRSSWDDGFGSYVENNILVTQRLLDALRSRSIHRFVFASSSSVYGNATTYPTSEDELPQPRSPYGVTKLSAEHLCAVYARTEGIPVVALRYFTVYGPRQRPDMAIHRLIEAALTGMVFPMFGGGDQIRDFTYVDDVVDANLLAASADVPAGAVINVAGGSASSLRETVDLVCELTGRPVSTQILPAARGDVDRTGGATDLARGLLRWRPTVDLRRGLSEQVAWHLARVASITGS